MKITTVDGIDYLDTYMVKIDNNRIDANKLFSDLEEFQKVYKEKTKTTWAKRGEWGSNPFSILNKFNGGYMSPTFFKEFNDNPALTLAKTFFKREKSGALVSGEVFHTILDDFYKLPKEERNRKELIEKAEDYIEYGMDREKILKNIKGFIKSDDYLGGKMEDNKLESVSEFKNFGDITVKSLDYKIPLKVAYTPDRVDFREDGAYLIDYKTGKLQDNATSFDGYLSQMLIYKWGVEQELNTKIKGGYLLFPDNFKKNQWQKLDFSIENEKILVERIKEFYKELQQTRKTRIFKHTDKGYTWLTTDDIKKFRNTMIDPTIWFSKLRILIPIGKESDRWKKEENKN